MLALVTTQCHFHESLLVYILKNTQVDVMITLKRQLLRVIKLR